MSHTNLSAHPHFNSFRQTTFVIHGYRPTGSPPVWLDNIVEMLLARKDMNVIVVDWNYGATNLNYLKAVENTHKTADNLTAFIKKMQVRDVSDAHPKPFPLCLDRLWCVTEHVTGSFSGTRSPSELHPHDRRQSRGSYIRLCGGQPGRVDWKNYR